MSVLQKAAAMEVSHARVYKKLCEVFAELPNVFFGGDLEKITGFPPSPDHRMLVASVLRKDFRCEQVSRGSNRWAWRKPLE